jgi:hypothetical protein
MHPVDLALLGERIDPDRVVEQDHVLAEKLGQRGALVVELQQRARHAADVHPPLGVQPPVRPLAGADRPGHLDPLAVAEQALLPLPDLDDVEELVALPGGAAAVPLPGCRVEDGHLLHVEGEAPEPLHLVEDALVEEAALHPPALDALVARDGLGGDPHRLQEGGLRPVAGARLAELGEDGQHDVPGEGVEALHERPQHVGRRERVGGVPRQVGVDEHAPAAPPVVLVDRAPRRREAPSSHEVAGAPPALPQGFHAGGDEGVVRQPGGAPGERIRDVGLPGLPWSR